MTDHTPAVEAKDCTKRTSDGEVMADALYAVHVEPPHDGLTNREEAEVIVQLLADAGYVLTPVQPVTETTDLRYALQIALDEPCTCRPFFAGHVVGHPDCPRGRKEHAALDAVTETTDLRAARVYGYTLDEVHSALMFAKHHGWTPDTGSGS